MKRQRLKQAKEQGDLTHNRKKQYVLPEGTAVPFLVDLGVMTREGNVVKNKYDKYRQINRFLEFIRDVLPLSLIHIFIIAIIIYCTSRNIS